ncbi:hypothetical protein BIW11_03173, partial [Tropilaelaps mercedesae]
MSQDAYTDVIRQLQQCGPQQQQQQAQQQQIGAGPLGTTSISSAIDTQGVVTAHEFGQHDFKLTTAGGSTTGVYQSQTHFEPGSYDVNRPQHDGSATTVDGMGLLTSDAFGQQLQQAGGNQYATTQYEDSSHNTAQAQLAQLLDCNQLLQSHGGHVGGQAQQTLSLGHLDQATLQATLGQLSHGGQQVAGHLSSLDDPTQQHMHLNGQQAQQLNSQQIQQLNGQTHQQMQLNGQQQIGQQQQQMHGTPQQVGVGVQQQQLVQQQLDPQQHQMVNGQQVGVGVG